MLYPYKPLTIALVCERRSTYLSLGYSLDECAELASEQLFEGILSALQRLGHRVVHVPDMKSLVQYLSQGKQKEWDLVFNYAEGLHGVAREAQVPALLEAYRIPFTLSDAATMALCLDKAKTSMVLKHHGIPTAPFGVIPGDDDDEDGSDGEINLSKYVTVTTLTSLSYPLFVKLSARSTSIGISSFSKVRTPKELNSTVKCLRERYPGEDILIEKFLAGREFTVGIIGTGREARVIGVTEIVWHHGSQSQSQSQSTPQSKSTAMCQELDGCPEKQSLGQVVNLDLTMPSSINFATQDSKEAPDWGGLGHEIKADMTDPKVLLASQAALDAYRVLKCRDLGRIDVRFGSSEDVDDVAYVVDVNTIPGLQPGWSQMPIIAEVNGISYDTLLAQILHSALKRNKLTDILG
ncbi:hypothetical protein AX15_005627 [Amanita polypyramis BW_CC]|nr:hypothetical protein AX15_005627 [Amanita polypyramis BW_CC]